MNGFTFNNIHSSDVFIKAIKTNPVIIAEKKHSFVEIPRKSGSVIVRDPTPKDVEEVVQCWYARPTNMSARAYGRELDQWLTTEKWDRLIFDDDPEYYRESVLISSVVLDDIRLPSGIFTLTFRCKPSYIPLSGE